MSLEIGDVFLAINPGLAGEKVHFHIVVHRAADNLIVVTYTTTNIESARRQCQRVERIRIPTIEPETLVLVYPTDSDSFTKECAINCNHVQMMHEESFTTRPAFKILHPIKNPHLIQRIKEAIKKSPIVEAKIARLL